MPTNSLVSLTRKYLFKITAIRRVLWILVLSDVAEYCVNAGVPGGTTFVDWALKVSDELQDPEQSFFKVGDK